MITKIGIFTDILKLIIILFFQKGSGKNNILIL